MPVIDTNVPIVANGRQEGVCEECVLACIDALLDARRRVVLVDDGFAIFEEYRQHLSHAGQPGAGDAFFKWLWENQANPECCRKVIIHPHEDRIYEEFPDDPRLVQFDRSDRKFVATAIADGSEEPILNAVDSDWTEHRVALEENGVRLVFLCPMHVC
jgi:hypothetical protein